MEHATHAPQPPGRVQAVRPAHGGHPDPVPTVDDRLAFYLSESGACVRIACTGGDEPLFSAIPHFGAPSDAVTSAHTPMAAIDSMLAELGR